MQDTRASLSAAHRLLLDESALLSQEVPKACPMRLRYIARQLARIESRSFDLIARLMALDGITREMVKS